MEKSKHISNNGAHTHTHNTRVHARTHTPDRLHLEGRRENQFKIKRGRDKVF